MYPRARASDLLVEAMPSETIVYDRLNHQVHCLNETASLIWQYSDGSRTVDDIARQLSETINVSADADMVRFGLDELRSRNLLIEDAAVTPAISRRELHRRFAVAGGALMTLLPAITSITAPTPAMARSQARKT